MKYVTAVLTAILLIAALVTGCGAPQSGDAGSDPGKKLVVFAAASMTEALTEIGEAYRVVQSDIELVFNFDSSGTLKTQILEGALCDVFVSAGQSQMDAIDVLQGSRFDILENKVCLSVPEGNPANLHSFPDLKQALENDDILLCIGNADVPVGQYSVQILDFLGLDEAALAKAGKITYASNVKEIVSHVSEQIVDCGLIYTTDAAAAGLAVIDIAPPESCDPIVYPAAVPASSLQQAEALVFLEYLKGDAASAIFRAAGFTPLGD